MSPATKPWKTDRHTGANARSLERGQKHSAWPAGALCLLGVAATLTISIADPLVGFSFCLAAFLLALALAARPGVTGTQPHTPTLPKHLPWRYYVATAAVCAIPLWGSLHSAGGLSVYPYASRVGTLRLAAQAAVFFAARRAVASHRLRHTFLNGFVWFCVVVSAVGVLAYYTSPGKIVWIFESPYPDTWGPFLSRNDFAAFLELGFPVALWHALEQSRLRAGRPVSGGKPRPNGNWLPARVPIWVPAWLLAAGYTSASRAGATLLTLETVFLLVSLRTPGHRGWARWKKGWRETGWRETGWKKTSGQTKSWHQTLWNKTLWNKTSWRSPVLQFALIAVLCITVTGVGVLWTRLHAPEPWQMRDRIAASTLRIIRDRPWAGFGIGTFRHVYPAYASFDSGAVVEHVHNEFLEWAVDGGVGFAMLWIVLAVATAGQALRNRWGVGVIAIFLHGLVDYPFAKFGITAWTFALMGALQAEGERSPSPSALNSQRDKEATSDGLA